MAVKIILLRELRLFEKKNLQCCCHLLNFDLGLPGNYLK